MPLLVSNTKSRAFGGMLALDFRWCSNAAIGLHAQMESVMGMSSPSILVFECRILKLQKEILLDVMPAVEQVTWETGSKEVSMTSLQSLKM